MQLMDWMGDHLKAESCGYKWPNMIEIQWEKLEEAGETETDLEIGGEDLEVGLVVIEEEEDHTPGMYLYCYYNPKHWSDLL